MMALELDPARRYATARALREDLERYVDGREAPIAVRSERWRAMARTSRYFFRRHRWRVAIGAMVVIGVAVYMETRDAVTASVTHRVLESAAADPVLAAFRMPDSGAGKSMIDEGDSVYPGDLLGVTVSTNQHEFMYVLSVFCRADGKRFLAPMQPEPLQEYLEGSTKKVLPLCREVEAGRTDFACATIGRASGSQNAIEGLLIITGREKHRDLDDWIDWLDARGADFKPRGVPEAEARYRLENPSLTRGDPAQGLTREQRAGFLPTPRGPSAARGKIVEFPGFRVLELECPVSMLK